MLGAQKALCSCFERLKAPPGRLALILAIVSACTHDTAPASEPVVSRTTPDAHVVLSPIRFVEFPDSIRPSGASFAANGAPIAWTDDGKILETRDDGLIVSKSLKLNGWTLRSVKIAPDGRITGLAARGNQTAMIRPGSLVPEIILSTDRLLAATPTHDGWSVVGRDSMLMLFVATISEAGKLQAAVRIGAMDTTDPSQQWPAIAVTPGHTLAAHGRETLTLYCVADGALQLWKESPRQISCRKPA